MKATNILQSMIKFHEQTSENGNSNNNEGCSPKHPSKHTNPSKFLQIRTPGSLLTLKTSETLNSIKAKNSETKNNKKVAIDVTKDDSPINSSDLANNTNNKRKSRKPNKRQICHVVQGNDDDQDKSTVTDSLQTNVKAQQNNEVTTMNMLSVFN